LTDSNKKLNGKETTTRPNKPKQLSSQNCAGYVVAYRLAYSTDSLHGALMLMSLDTI